MKSNIHKRFGANHVLNGVSLDIDEGEIVTIIGRSGSGKSTLLRCLNALENVDDGEIRVGGERPRRHAAAIPPARGHRVPAVQPVSAPERGRNITLAPVLNGRIGKPQGRELALDVLRRRTGRKIDAWPALLSGGQQQRVAIARCLAMAPALMLFDRDHVGAGPRAGGRSAQGHGRHGAPGHDDGAGHARDGLRAQRRVKVVFMHQGRVWEQGPPAELFAHPARPSCASSSARPRPPSTESNTRHAAGQDGRRTEGPQHRGGQGSTLDIWLTDNAPGARLVRFEEHALGGRRLSGGPGQSFAENSAIALKVADDNPAKAPQLKFLIRQSPAHAAVQQASRVRSPSENSAIALKVADDNPAMPQLKFLIRQSPTRRSSKPAEPAELDQHSSTTA